MPKVHWIDVPRTADYRLVVGLLPSDDQETLYSPLLKTAGNLVARTCAKLALGGRYAVQLSRSAGLEVRIAFERTDDAQRFAAAAGTTLGPAADQPSPFAFDADVWDRLERIAGRPDTRGAGRRARARSALEHDALSWAERPWTMRKAPRDVS